MEKEIEFFVEKHSDDILRQNSLHKKEEAKKPFNNFQCIHFFQYQNIPSPILLCFYVYDGTVLGIVVHCQSQMIYYRCMNEEKRTDKSDCEKRSKM